MPVVELDWVLYKSTAGHAWRVEEAGLGLKMCYRHFPKVKKPHNHKNPDNQARTVNLKNETEFPSDI